VRRNIRCFNGGYRDPNDCSKCKCPDGFGGRRCRHLARVAGGINSNESFIPEICFS